MSKYTKTEVLRYIMVENTIKMCIFAKNSTKSLFTIGFR